MRDDLIGGGGQVVTAAGGHIHQAGYDGDSLPALERVQVAPHHIRGGHAASVGVDPQDHSMDTGVGSRPIQLLAEQLDRVFALGKNPRHIRIQQEPIHVDQSDFLGVTVPADRHFAERTRCGEGRCKIYLALGLDFQWIATPHHEQHGKKQIGVSHGASGEIAGTMANPIPSGLA